MSSSYLMQFFKSDHLPENLRVVSAPFGALAETLSSTIQNSPELTESLRKLLEAKDCAVRAVLFEYPESKIPYKTTLTEVTDITSLKSYLESKKKDK